VAAAAHGPPSAFDRAFAALLRESAARVEGAARFGVGVDPRDGLHYALALSRGDQKGKGKEAETDGCKEDEEEYAPVPVPQLDACCALPAGGRRDAARAALPADARAALDAEGHETAEGVRRAAQLRLRWVRWEQRRTDPCLDPAAFRRLVEAVADGAPSESRRGLLWTAEALAALQAAAEAFAMDVGEAALLASVEGAGRVLVGRAEVERALTARRVRPPPAAQGLLVK
jgi:histone H3/H4